MLNLIKADNFYTIYYCHGTYMCQSIAGRNNRSKSLLSDPGRGGQFVQKLLSRSLFEIVVERDSLVELDEVVRGLLQLDRGRLGQVPVERSSNNILKKWFKLNTLGYRYRAKALA
jgi:hypothetical protein